MRYLLNQIRMSKVVVADIQILIGAICFGIGFIGQRAVSVDGLGPMTCNAFRFGLSTILLAACKSSTIRTCCIHHLLLELCVSDY